MLAGVAVGVLRLSGRGIAHGSCRVLSASRAGGFGIAQRTFSVIPRREASAGGGASAWVSRRWEQYANRDLGDAERQAAFYRYLLPSNPSAIVTRYEDERVARNAECTALYNSALRAMGVDADEAAAAPATSASSMARAEHADVSSAAGPPLDRVFERQQEPIKVQIEEAPRVRMLRALRSLFAAGLVVYLITYGIEAFAESSGLKKVWSSSKIEEVLPEEGTSVRFNDVCGVDEAKEELEEVVAFLRNPRQFTALGGKLPKGILLTGPPGTGKTMLARAVAGEAGVPFFVMSGSQFDEVFVGVGAKRIRELFATARARGPSIVFIDELDAIGQKRNAKEAAHARQTLNQLLVELDGFNTSAEAPTVFIAATNFPESLDPALTRPGRFDKLVHVPLPDVRGRIKILDHHCQGVRIGRDIDLSVLARGTPGFSGADLANLVNQAAVRGSKERRHFVTMQDFDWAKDKIMMGAERRSHFVTEENKLMTAYHEGGHALVAMLTDGANKPYKATIMPRGQSLGMTIMLPEMDKENYSFKEYRAQIDVAMGGRVAEELIYGRDGVTGGAHSDIRNATRLARSLISELGYSERLGPVAYEDPDKISSETNYIIEQEVKKMLEASLTRVTRLLTSRRADLDRLAHALVEREYMTYDEMLRLLENPSRERI